MVVNCCSVYLCNSLQDEMFQKFSFDTSWAVDLISRITNDEDMPIEGDAIVRQVMVYLMFLMPFAICFFMYIVFLYSNLNVPSSHD